MNEKFISLTFQFLQMILNYIWHIFHIAAHLHVLPIRLLSVLMDESLKMIERSSPSMILDLNNDPHLIMIYACTLPFLSGEAKENRSHLNYDYLHAIEMRNWIYHRLV